MGRTSKFFFPAPGRRASVLPPAKTESIPTSSSSSNSRPQQRQQQPLSKAQRLLGTDNLNIDSPSRDDDGACCSYTPSSSRSRAATSPSRMSIEIAESTTEDDAYSASERGGGVPPIRLNGKASSTLLGRGAVMRGDYGGGGEDMASDLPDIRSERSNSTLRSYYDRGSTPLAVSQQTSASPLSPHGIDAIAEDDGDDTNYNQDRDSYFPTSPMQPQPKKKTSRLDLTRLFHKKSKDAQSLRPPSSTSRAPPSPPPTPPPPTPAARPETEQEPAYRAPEVFQNDHHATDDLWDHYEQRVYADRAPAPVPEQPRAAAAAAPKVPVIAAPRPRHEAPNGASYPDLRPRNGHDRETAPPRSAHSAWRARDHLGARGGGGGQNWDATSRQNSILSLSESSSSDDDERGDDKDTSESDVMGNGARRGGKHNARTNGGATHKSSSSTTSSKKQSSSSKTRQKPKPLRNLDAFPRPASSTSHPSQNTPSPHHSDFLTIPSPISLHLSGPWRSCASSTPTTAIPPPPGRRPGGALPGVPQGMRRHASSA
ncbi:hypothetical protein VE04_08661, partial [Pseudogymnoascus sp. 24MN13]